MWLFFKQENLSYNLRKGPILKVTRAQSTNYDTNLFTFKVLLNGTIFLPRLNPVIQFSNLKQKLKIWEILTAGILFASKLVF